MLTYKEALAALSASKPKRKKRDRYQQRDEMQQRIIPCLDVENRDAFERAMNTHFRL